MQVTLYFMSTCLVTTNKSNVFYKGGTHRCIKCRLQYFKAEVSKRLHMYTHKHCPFNNDCRKKKETHINGMPKY